MPVTPTQTDSASTPPRIRKEIRNLSADERGLFIAAVKRLKASGTADRLTKMHIDYQTVLAGAQQLPWLRQFIFNFERELQDIDAAVTIPYWDAAYDGARPERSPVFSPNWAGGNGAGLSHVVVQAGAFGEWHADYPESHQLRRAWNGGTWITAWQTTEVINAVVAQETTYAAFRARLIISTEPCTPASVATWRPWPPRTIRSSTSMPPISTGSGRHGRSRRGTWPSTTGRMATAVPQG
jgi:hypothetical protein